MIFLRVCNYKIGSISKDIINEKEFRLWAWNRDLDNYQKTLIEHTNLGWIDTPVYCDDVNGVIRIWEKVQGVHNAEVGST